MYYTLNIFFSCYNYNRLIVIGVGTLINVINKYKTNYRHISYLLLFIPLLFSFYLLQRFIEPKYIIYSDIDSHIPFIKEFIIPYVIWYAYIAWPFIYFGIYSKNDFIDYFKFIYIGMFTSFVIYFIFPNGLALRQPIVGNDIFSELIKLLRYIDPPTNVCPSIHVYDAIAVYIIVRKSSLFQTRTIIKNSCLTLTILICISTVFIKQHSIIDVIAGIALSMVMYLCIYVSPKVFYYKKELNK